MQESWNDEAEVVSVSTSSLSDENQEESLDGVFWNKSGFCLFITLPLAVRVMYIHMFALYLITISKIIVYNYNYMWFYTKYVFSSSLISSYCVMKLFLHLGSVISQVRIRKKAWCLLKWHTSLHYLPLVVRVKYVCLLCIWSQ